MRRRKNWVGPWTLVDGTWTRKYRWGNRVLTKIGPFVGDA